MSNVSTSHNVMKLDKTSKAFSGQRMARVIAKQDKEGQYQSPNLTESKFVSLPVIEGVEQSQLTALMPHIVAMLSDAQDAIIRERIIVDGATAINDEEISVDACIKYLDDAAKGNRVTGEYIAKWFTETYGNAAIEFVAKLCNFGDDAEQYTEAQLDVLGKKVNVLSSMFAGFASGKYSPDIPKCKAMIKFGEFLGTENLDARMQNYVAKAAATKEVKEKELSMDALGF